jgi:hypothetical protein
VNAGGASPISDTPQALVDACRRCDRLARVWARWAGLPFPDLEGRMREFEVLSRESTPEMARDRLRGEGWAWVPAEMVAELAERARREAMQPWVHARRLARRRP